MDRKRVDSFSTNFNFVPHFSANFNFFHYFSAKNRVDNSIDESKSFEDVLEKICDVFLNLETSAVKTSRNKFEIVEASNLGKRTVARPDNRGWNSVVCLVTEGFGIVARAAKKFGIEK